MTIALQVKGGAVRNYPQDGDEGYGVDATNLMSDVVTSLNATPITSTVGQYDYVLGSAAQVTAGTASHSTLAAILAVASDGDSVYVLTNTYTSSSTIDIDVQLNIINQSSNCIFTTDATALTSVLLFSKQRTNFIGGQIIAGANTDYCIETTSDFITLICGMSASVVNQYVLLTSGEATFQGLLTCDQTSFIYGGGLKSRMGNEDTNQFATIPFIFGNEGDGTDGDNSAGIICVNGLMYFKDRAGNKTALQVATAANTQLSNLANPTSFNRDLIPDGNMTRSLGSDPNEIVTIYTKNVAHNDAAFPDLAILTSGNNGNITLTPDGTGKVKIDTTIEIETASILESTADLTLRASAANKDVILKTEATGRGKVDIGGTEYNIPYPVLIQDYTVQGAVGAALQQFAGHQPTVAELENFWGAGTVKALHRFGAGAALVTDDVGAYNLSLGAGGKAPANANGILNTAFAISFDGGDYATNGTLLDDMTTTYSGAGKGFLHSFWMSAPTDGQPAANAQLFIKTNSAANDTYSLYLSSIGQIGVLTNGNSASSKTILSSTILPNGANTAWLHIVIGWSTTKGLMLWVNGICECVDTTATTLMVDGTTTDFFIGGTNTTPTNPYTGLICNSVIANRIVTQADVDLLYATTIPEPVSIQGKTYVVKAYKQPNGVVKNAKQAHYYEVCRYNNNIYLPGGVRTVLDSYKYIAEVL